MRYEADNQLDAVGVGIGPFNLSVAALMQPLTELRSRFFERAPEFQWHPGLLLPDAMIQVSFLKDLVTLVDPTSRYSFVSFLYATRRLYRFITAEFPRVTRVEFNQYLRWVCESLPNLNFARPVDGISLCGSSLVVDAGREQISTRNVILGTGLSPRIPACARPHMGPTVIHASRFLDHHWDTRGRRIAVIGGGQSGAEVFLHILNQDSALPRSVVWVTRRSNFLPLDESPFTNELFVPAYSDFFFNLDPAQKAMLLAEQKLASDGISSELLGRIYRRLYHLEFLEDNGRRYTMYPGRELVDLEKSADEWRLALQDKLTSRIETVGVDFVVLCTGAEYKRPPCLEPITHRIDWEHGGPKLREDFSVIWDGPDTLKLFAQNAARLSRGIADPNLSLMAWRSAKIVNSIARRTVYDSCDADRMLEWECNGGGHGDITETTGDYSNEEPAWR